jgi:hypothetical protein
MNRVAIAGLAFGCSTAAAQPPSEIRLVRASGEELAADFTALLSMRELADGRLLLTQRGEPGLAVADFQVGSLRPIGRKGRGPGEFELAWSLTALAGDSTVLCDFSNRWLILVGDSIVRTVPRDDAVLKALAHTYACPLGADRAGRMLTRDFRPRGSGQDSSDLALVQRVGATKALVTALRLHPPLSGEQRAVSTPGGGMGTRRVPLNVAEEGVLFPDGWLAVARIQPYRVDWRSPDGTWVRGRPLPFRSIPFSQRERDAYALGRRGVASAPVWPREIPPFAEPPAIQPTPDGLLAVRRVPTADAPETRVDLIDRTGALRGVVVLGVRERILGFGAKSVYVVRMDEDDLEYIRRHPWPATAR